VRGAGKPHDECFIDCVATMAQYVHDSSANSRYRAVLLILMYLQAHHLDLEFYDTHFAKALTSRRTPSNGALAFEGLIG